MDDIRQKMIQRVRALRAKAADAAATESEAQAAAEAATRLLLQYDLEEAELQVENPDRIVHQMIDIHPAVRLASNAIGALTETRPIEHNTYTARLRSVDLRFYGQPADVEMAMYLAELVRAAAERGWMQAFMNQPMSAANRKLDITEFRNGYYEGLGVRLGTRIRELADDRAFARSNNNQTALVVAKRGQINVVLEEIYETITKRKFKPLKGTDEGREAGRRDADKVGLGRPVNGSSGPAMLRSA